MKNSGNDRIPRAQTTKSRVKRMESFSHTGTKCESEFKKIPPEDFAPGTIREIVSQKLKISRVYPVKSFSIARKNPETDLVSPAHPHTSKFGTAFRQ